MNIKEETQELIDRLVEKWDEVKSKEIIGSTHWSNPNLIWVLVTDREEGYEGSQAQIGITRDGKIVWEYQSHCSCNGYEDTLGIPEEFTEEDLKSYELEGLTEEWETRVTRNIKEMLD